MPADAAANSCDYYFSSQKPAGGSEPSGDDRWGFVPTQNAVGIAPTVPVGPSAVSTGLNPTPITDG
jgi:hypothetical protein